MIGDALETTPAAAPLPYQGFRCSRQVLAIFGEILRRVIEVSSVATHPFEEGCGRRSNELPESAERELAFAIQLQEEKEPCLLRSLLAHQARGARRIFRQREFKVHPSSHYSGRP